MTPARAAGPTRTRRGEEPAALKGAAPREKAQCCPLREGDGKGLAGVGRAEGPGGPGGVLGARRWWVARGGWIGPEGTSGFVVVGPVWAPESCGDAGEPSGALRVLGVLGGL